jgi:hypothetical protein
VGKSCYAFAAWFLAATVTFATLGPPQYRPHSNFGQDGEYALTFVLIGLTFGFAYLGQKLLTATVSVAMIGTLEVLQVEPGTTCADPGLCRRRAAACIGFAFSSSGPARARYSARNFRKPRPRGFPEWIVISR